ncbi:MAG: AAA family ATPase [Nitrospirae bacterium]|nr:AAA family ATPase [Nitrospirota bacterium]
MYREAFDLREKPFSLAADPRYLYMSQQHWEAMAHLMYGVEDDWGFVLITGEIGTGKTTLCRLLLDQMPADVEVAFLMNPKLTVPELLVSVCDEFRIEHPPAEAGTRELFDRISVHLLDLHARAKKALLIIDEAQYLSPEVIDQLRLLTNLETAEGKLLRIILLGQPELREKLAQPELEQMSQRITARYHLGPLSEQDVAAYVSHRMSLAGARRQFFTRLAMKALFRMSRGVPRLINVICDRALLGSCMKKETVVSRTTLIQAGREVLGEERFRNRSRRPAGLRWAAAGVAVGLAGAVLIFLSFNLSLTKAAPVTPLYVPFEAAVRAAAPGAAAAARQPVPGSERRRDGSNKDQTEKKVLTKNLPVQLTEHAFCSDGDLFKLACMDSQKAAHGPGTPVPSSLRRSSLYGGDLFVTLKALRDNKTLPGVGGLEAAVDIPDIHALWTVPLAAPESIGLPDAAQLKLYRIAAGRRKG